MKQEVIQGDVAEALVTIIERVSPKKIVWCTGRTSFKSSSVFPLFKELSSKFSIIHINDFQVNPVFEDVLRIVDQHDLTEVDLLISIGGGSVMDFTKLLKYYHGEAKETMLAKPVDNAKSLHRIRHLAIPTTAGSGSDATHFAVMYKDQEKQSIAHAELLPDYVILDPLLTLSKDKFLTAVTGMDAICQALESLWAIEGNEISASAAEEALKRLIPSFTSVVNTPNLTLRNEVLLGAHLAGRAINVSTTTGPHALAYYLTQFHGIPHGEAVGLNIDFFLAINWTFLSNELQERILSVFGVRNKDEVIDVLRNFKLDTGLKVSLKEVNSLDIDTYLSAINMDRMKNNPAQYDKETFKKLLLDYHQL